MRHLLAYALEMCFDASKCLKMPHLPNRRKACLEIAPIYLHATTQTQELLLTASHTSELLEKSCQPLLLRCAKGR